MKHGLAWWISQISVTITKHLRESTYKKKRCFGSPFQRPQSVVHWPCVRQQAVREHMVEKAACLMAEI